VRRAGRGAGGRERHGSLVPRRRSLLALASPADRRALPEPTAEPRLEETEGKRSQLATYQDLLRTGTDEDRFEVLATSVPCRVDPASGERAELGPPGLYYLLHDSPDRTHLLAALS
jgi:hypothetical protein